MKEPTRMRETNPAVARLAAALDGDTPSAETIARALALAGSPSDGSATPPPSTTRRLTSAPAWLIGLAAIACAVGVTWTTKRTTTESVKPIATIAASPSLSLSSAAPSRAEDPGIATMRVEDLPRAAPAPTIAAPPVTATPASTATSTFGEELALIATARAALARGDADGCLRAVDGYDRRFHEGLFVEEATVMRVEALAARGDTAARRLGEAFLSKNPRSTYANRIRSVLTTLE